MKHQPRALPLFAALLTPLLSGSPDAASPMSALTGLSGDTVSAIAISRGPSATFIAAIPGMGLFAAGGPTNALTSTSPAWTAQNCEGCGWVRNLAFDGTDRVWVAASGYGLWRGTVNGTFSAISLSDSNIAHWVARGADGNIWVVTGNSVLEVQSGDKTLARGSNAATLSLRQVALGGVATGKAYAASANEVFVLSDDDNWQALKAPRQPLTITQVNNVLHMGSTDGAWKYDQGTWTELGPKGGQVNDLIAAADGSLVIATERQGMLQYSNGKWNAVNETDTFADRRVKALATDARGNVYAGTASGLQLPLSVAADRAAARGTQREINAALNAGIAQGALKQVTSTRNDVYALLDGQGVFSRVGKSSKWEPVNDGLDDEPIRLFGTSAAAYVLTTSGSVFSYTAPTSSAGSWVKLASLSGATSEIGVAPDGTLWVSLRDGPPLQRDVKSGKWTPASVGLEGAGRVTVFAHSDTGTTYAGTSRGGAYRWDNTARTWSRVGNVGLPMLPGRMGVARTPVTSLLIDSGKLFAGTEHGVFYVAENATGDGGWTGISKGLVELHVTSLTTDAKGNLIAGTLNGAFTVASSSADPTWSAYSDTRGEVIASVVKVGNEVVVATRKQPGKSSRTFIGD